MDRFGAAVSTKMRMATQVWLRAMLTTISCKKISGSQDSLFTNWRRGEETVVMVTGVYRLAMTNHSIQWG